MFYPHLSSDSNSKTESQTVNRRRFLALCGLAGATAVVMAPALAQACSDRKSCGSIEVSRKGGDIIVKVKDAAGKNKQNAKSSARIGKGRFDEEETDFNGEAAHGLGAKKGDKVDVVVRFKDKTTGKDCVLTVENCVV